MANAVDEDDFFHYSEKNRNNEGTSYYFAKMLEVDDDVK